MNAYRFLNIVTSASDINRPVLTWGHVSTLNGAVVSWTSDGYRLHIVWDELPNIDGWIQFLNSQKFAFAEKPRVPDMSLIVNGFKPDMRLRIETVTLEMALSVIKDEYSADLIVAPGLDNLYLASDTMAFRLKGIVREIDNFEPVVLSLNPAYLNGAIDTNREYTTIQLNTKDANSPYQVGDSGSQCAVIMPMSDSKNHNRFTAAILASLEKKAVL